MPFARIWVLRNSRFGRNFTARLRAGKFEIFLCAQKRGHRAGESRFRPQSQFFHETVPRGCELPLADLPNDETFLRIFYDARPRSDAEKGVLRGGRRFSAVGCRRFVLEYRSTKRGILRGVCAKYCLQGRIPRRLRRVQKTAFQMDAGQLRIHQKIHGQDSAIENALV